MARNDGIDRTVARNQDVETADDLAKVQEHNEREKDSYSNEDIEPERSSLNVHFKAPTAGYAEMFEQMEQDKVISTRGLKADAVKYGELVFDVNSAYFYNHGGYDFAKQFYADAYKAAVVVEVSGVHIKDQLAVELGIVFQTTDGDDAISLHLFKHFCVAAGGCFEMNIVGQALRYDIRVCVRFFFALVVPLRVGDFGSCQIFCFVLWYGQSRRFLP